MERKKGKKKKGELILRILHRRNPLVDELAWKHGSWCITPKGNKLKMVNLSKFMYKTYIKPVWFLFFEKYRYSFWRTYLCLFADRYFTQNES